MSTLYQPYRCIPLCVFQLYLCVCFRNSLFLCPLYKPKPNSACSKEFHKVQLINEKYYLQLVYSLVKIRIKSHTTLLNHYRCFTYMSHISHILQSFDEFWKSGLAQTLRPPNLLRRGRLSTAELLSSPPVLNHTIFLQQSPYLISIALHGEKSAQRTL